MKRHSYKCRDCLALFAVDQDRPFGSVVCGICESDAVKFFGVVCEDKAIPTEDRCNCDQRCTSAAGPKCSCKCGGTNHMQHTLGWTRVEHHDQAVKLSCTDAATVAKHKKIAEEWRAAVNAARGRKESHPLYQSFREKKWIPRDAWEWFFYGGKALSKVLGASSHPSRMKKINTVFMAA